MTTAWVLLAAVVGLLLGSGITGIACVKSFQIGVQAGRDDRALDPGESTGQLPAVGESSGRHRLPDWPAGADTERFEAVNR
jgi:hypothetical protein